MVNLVRLVAGCFLGLVCVNVASAQFQPKQLDTTRFDRVNDLIERAPNGAKVTLQGNIIRRLSDELYLFSDPGGILAIEIDDSFEWPGEINEETLIEVSGRVDRDEGRVELEVTRVRIVDASR